MQNYTLTFHDPVDSKVELTIPADNREQAIDLVGDVLGQWIDDGGLEGLTECLWILTQDGGYIASGLQNLKSL